MGVLTEAFSSVGDTVITMGTGARDVFEVTMRDGAAVVAISGKLVRQSCPALDAVIDGVLETSPATIVIDLAGLSVLDTFGVDRVLACRRRASSVGAVLQLCDPNELVTRILELTADDRAVATEFDSVSVPTMRSRNASSSSGWPSSTGEVVKGGREASGALFILADC